MQHSSTIAPSAGAEIMGNAGRRVRESVRVKTNHDPEAAVEAVRDAMKERHLLEAWAVRHDPEFRREHLEFPGALEALAVAMLASNA